jgi:hypothetical protein
MPGRGRGKAGAFVQGLGRRGEFHQGAHTCGGSPGYVVPQQGQGIACVCRGDPVGPGNAQTDAGRGRVSQSRRRLRRPRWAVSLSVVPPVLVLLKDSSSTEA